jgi:hypothetical protein
MHHQKGNIMKKEYKECGALESEQGTSIVRRQLIEGGSFQLRKLPSLAGIFDPPIQTILIQTTR